MAEDERMYRALIVRTDPERPYAAFLHIVRDAAESSLCGIPRAGLSPGSDKSDIVCPACIEWLAKRTDFSGAHPKVEKRT